MIIFPLQHSRWHQHLLRLKDFFPTFAFFAGFIWDALTIGKRVNASDLWMLSAYLVATIPIIWWMVKKASLASQLAIVDDESTTQWKIRLPYMAIQFLFGSLFSALFILYFKSSSHLSAIIWSIGLGALLVANEYLEVAYKRFTLTWTLFGFCAILLLNFVVPFVVGSVHAIWFFISTSIAVLATRFIKLKVCPQFGNITPTYIVAAVITLAYVFDVIPPVPLVKRDIQVGTHFEKAAGEYRVLQDKAPWWIFWRSTLNSVHISAGEQVYCVSAIFAPRGLEARLYHNWQYYDANAGWVTKSRIGFGLAGGRDNGFRGYTFKQNMAFGEWRVNVETENGRTVATHEFSVIKDMSSQEKIPKIL
jgi:hypothetical protein